MATTPFSDGNLQLTTISSDVLAAIFSTMHETQHREGVTEPLSPAELALYGAVVAELTARAGDVKREAKP